MKKYFSQLRPLERRLVVGVGVVLLIALNWVFIWPHFSDWSSYGNRLQDAKSKLQTYQQMISQQPALEKQMKVFENAGEFVAPEDQSINLMLTIQGQASACGFGIQNFGHSQMSTNQFFIEQKQNITVQATEAQLVDFLYKLGSSSSMIRVRDLTLSPDPAHQKLTADIGLVASYQKNPPASAAKTATAKAK